MLTMIREFVALGRAELNRPYSASGDPEAQRKLTQGMAAIGPDGQPTEMSGPLLTLLAPRAPYFDRLVQGAIDTGITQVVNIGAGYDDRALRFHSPGVRFFELDLPHVVDDKTRRLRQTKNSTTNLILVPSDFRTDDVAELLNECGHDDHEPTLFLAEHVVLFLTPSEADRLFTALSQRAAAGSAFALTAEVHPPGLNSTHVLSAADELMFGGAGPLHAIMSRDEWMALLRDAGWLVENAGEVIAIDHFQVPLDNDVAQIQTQFITAASNRH